MFSRLPNISQLFGTSKKSTSRTTTAPKETSRSVSTVRTVDIQSTARLGQPSAYKSQSDKRKKKWFDAKLSPRSLKLQEQGFFIEGADPPFGPNAQTVKTVHPEISVWAKLNMSEDQTVWFSAQVCPSKEMELAGAVKVHPPLAYFLCAVNEPKPLPCRLVCLHRTAPSKFHASKPDSMEVQKIKQVEITEEGGMWSIQVHHDKLGAWIWHFRNKWERDQMARYLAKMYAETVGHALKIGGVTRTDLRDDGFHPRYFERTFLRKEQADVIKQKRKEEKLAAREEPDLSDDDDEVSQKVKQQRMARARSLAHLKPQKVVEYIPSVGRDADPKIGMLVKCSGIAALECPQAYHDAKEGTGVVTMMIVGPAGVEACEVEWYMTGRRSQVPLKAEGTTVHGYNLELVVQRGYRVRRTEAIFGDELVGMDVYPYVGMRVRLRRQALEEMPSLMGDSKGMLGTITWISAEDEDGDGILGDTCKVLWETGTEGIYYTGFKGKFFLRHSPDGLSRAPSAEHALPTKPELPHLSPRDIPKLQLPSTLPGNAPVFVSMPGGGRMQEKIERRPSRAPNKDGDFPHEADGSDQPSHSKDGSIPRSKSHAGDQPSASKNGNILRSKSHEDYEEGDDRGSHSGNGNLSRAGSHKLSNDVHFRHSKSQAHWNDGDNSQSTEGSVTSENGDRRSRQHGRTMDGGLPALHKSGDGHGSPPRESDVHRPSSRQWAKAGDGRDTPLSREGSGNIPRPQSRQVSGSSAGPPSRQVSGDISHPSSRDMSDSSDCPPSRQVSPHAQQRDVSSDMLRMPSSQGPPRSAKRPPA